MTTSWASIVKKPKTAPPPLGTPTADDGIIPSNVRPQPQPQPQQLKESMKPQHDDMHSYPAYIFTHSTGCSNCCSHFQK